MAGDALDDFIRQHRRGVLATIRSSGHPQMSVIAFHYGDDGIIRVSVTDSRAKTANVRRDPKAALHVMTDDKWQWAVAQGQAEVTEVTTEPGDAVGQELLELYNAVNDEPHPDPDEFLQAMVDDRRCVLRLHVDHTYGQLST